MSETVQQDWVFNATMIADRIRRKAEGLGAKIVNTAIALDTTTVRKWGVYNKKYVLPYSIAHGEVAFILDGIYYFISLDPNEERGQHRYFKCEALEHYRTKEIWVPQNMPTQFIPKKTFGGKRYKNPDNVDFWTDQVWNFMQNAEAVMGALPHTRYHAPRYIQKGVNYLD